MWNLDNCGQICRALVMALDMYLKVGYVVKGCIFGGIYARYPSLMTWNSPFPLALHLLLQLPGRTWARCVAWMTLNEFVSTGDEYGHSHNGNNNWYGHDNAMTHFDWVPSDAQQAFFRFYSGLIHFRRECPLLGRESFLEHSDITWHEEHWDNDGSKFLAFTIHGKCAPLDTIASSIPWSLLNIKVFIV
jgi:hypothetical protein